MYTKYENVTTAIIFATKIDNYLFSNISSTVSCCNHNILPYMKYCPICAQPINHISIPINDFSGNLSIFIAKNNTHYIGFAYDVYEQNIKNDSIMFIPPTIEFSNIVVESSKVNHTHEEMIDAIVKVAELYNWYNLIDVKTYVVMLKNM